jgi:epsilon-lactone hydrolase
MAVVRTTHHHGEVQPGILDGVDESANVIALRAPDSVDLRQLRAFVAVAEELNFGRAAQRLYVSQPSLSRQVKSLERSIGCALLLRDTHRVELTVAGHALLAHTRPVLAALDDAIAAAKSVGGELNARMMAVWAPLLAVAPTMSSVETLREVFESVLAVMPVPDDMPVRPVRAGGVPALAVGDEPAMLYLHGGGFVLGSAYGYRPLVAGVVAAAGSGAVVPDYRLAPEHPYPAALQDALAAFRWLAARRGAPQVALVADSSGCALTLALLRALQAAGEAMPAGAVLMCPSVGASGGLHELQQPFDAVAEASMACAADASGELAGLPPLLIQCATDDPAVEEAEALHRRARADGVAVRLERYRTPAHVFQLFWTFLPDGADAMSSAGAFVRSLLDATGEATGKG